MIEKNVISSKVIKHGAKAIFEIISNHEETPSWVHDVKSIKIKQPGQPMNGKGCIREVEFKPKSWPKIKEKILTFVPYESYSYSIIDPMPGMLNHLGVWRLDLIDKNTTRVHWEVKFEFKKYHWFSLFFLSRFARTFKKIQERALIQLETKITSISS